MAQTVERTCYRHPDRVTGLSCSECGRPICTECMTPAPVGIRCPEHSGRPQGVARVSHGVRRAGYQGTGMVTRILIAANCVIYLVTVAQGAGLNAPGGSLFVDWLLFGPAVAQGDWWRLITAAFLHGNLIHLMFNMLALYWIGTALEQRLGTIRYIGLYLVSGLAGSAGALLVNPTSPTVGASGAIFGMLGAALVLERQRDYVFGGSVIPIIVLNLLISFWPGANISIGGHIGGLLGGALATLGLSRFGRGHAAYGRLGAFGFASIAAVAVGSVAVAYFKVRGYS